MGNISNGIETICEDIVKGYEARENSTEDRIKDVKALKKEAQGLRDNARKFVSHCKKLHKEMAEGLRTSLKEDKEELIKDVNSLRKDFKNKIKEIRLDLKEASESWSDMSETLKSKRKPETKKRGESK